MASAYDELSAQTLSSADPAVILTVSALNSWTALGVDETSNDPALDVPIIYPAMFGPSLDDSILFGIGFASSMSSRVSTWMTYAPGLEPYPASLLAAAVDTDTGATSMRVVSGKLSDFYGQVWTVPLASLPTLSLPAPGASLSEGDPVSFTTPSGSTFGMLQITRDSDQWQWTIRFPPGRSSLSIPRVGLLFSGGHAWSVMSVHVKDVTYETLSGMPDNPQDAMALIDWLVQSEKREATVP